MERSEQRRVVEALILGAPEPIAGARIAEVIRARPALVRTLVEELNAAYVKEGRAFEIAEVAGGFQLRTLAAYAPYLLQIQKTRPLRLSQAALETLSIVAYRQPATRAEVERVRGVDVGAVLRSLLERKLVRIAGHREVPGRPLLYATTRRFLEVFGLSSLEDLPSLRDIEELAAEAGITLPDASGAEAPEGEPEPAEPADAAAPPESAVTAFHEAEPVGKPH